MKALIIAREFPVKHRDFLISSLFPGNFKIHYVSWNRKERSDTPTNNTYVFKKNLEKFRSIKYVFNITKYVRFIDDVISKTNPNLLIISHYSLYIPFLIFSKQKGIKLILDVHDLPSFRNIFLFKFVLFIENFFIRNVDNIILASKYFKPFYSDKKTLVLDNIPPQKNLNTISPTITKKGVIRIGFVGKLRYPKLYKLAIDCINNFDNLEFHFYGDGSAEQLLVEYIKKLNAKNIFFHGRFNKNDLLKIYAEIDLLWACYPSNNYNVKYATSNKALESLFYNTPCVFSSGTLLAKDFESQSLGFSIDSKNKDEIINFLNNMSHKKLNSVKENILKEELPNLDLYKQSFKEFLR